MIVHSGLLEMIDLSLLCKTDYLKTLILLMVIVACQEYLW